MVIVIKNNLTIPEKIQIASINVCRYGNEKTIIDMGNTNNKQNAIKREGIAISTLAKNR